MESIRAPKAAILVIDDDRGFRLLAEEALAAEGFEVRTAGTLQAGLSLAKEAMPDVVILDRGLPDGDGIGAIPSLGNEKGAAPLVVVATSDGNLESAALALRAGADYITKPIALADLVVKLNKMLENRRLRDRLRLGRSAGAGPPMVWPTSERMRSALMQLSRTAQKPFEPVLLIGPPGSGRKRAAEILHAETFLEKDPDAPFVALSCAAWPGELIEKELFGDAHGRGLLETATGGTLFLGEIAELPLGAQTRLYRLLETMRFRRARGAREITAEVRVVASAQAPLRERVRRGAFIEDLCQRLSAQSVAIPALADRDDDIPELAHAFVRWFAQRFRKRVTGIAPDALQALGAYSYPGNVRELMNIIERAVIVAPDPVLAATDIMLVHERPESRNSSFFHVALRDDGTPRSIDEVERAYVHRVLEHHGGHRTAAAQTLGISYPTFLKRLRELGLS